jgi:hypothetical protein
MDNHQITAIKNFILNPNENSEGYFLFFKIFENKYFKFKFPKETSLDSFHDFLYDKVWNNKVLLNFIQSNDETSIIRYIGGTINNYLLTKWNKDNKYNNTLSLNNKMSDSDTEYIENLKEEQIANEIKFEAYSILEQLDDFLDERKKRILCQFLYGKEKDFNLNMKQDAFYKAVERLKKELSEFILKNKFARESMDFFINNIFVSEICEQFG